MGLKDFTEAYIECAIWSSTDDDGTPLDKDYGPSDLSLITRDAMYADCKSFFENDANQAPLMYWDDAQAGHDFWLTRNGHGAGFWDRYFGDNDEARAGEALTKAAKAYGSFYLFAGDDGEIHHV